MPIKYTNLIKKFISYFFIGIIGLFVDNGVLWLLTVHFPLNATLSAFISGEAGNINNFIWNNLFTFKKHNEVSLVRKIVNYHAVVWLGLLVKTGLFRVLLFHLTIIHSYNTRLFISNNIAIGIVMFLNFTLNYFFTWKAHKHIEIL